MRKMRNYKWSYSKNEMYSLSQKLAKEISVTEVYYVNIIRGEDGFEVVRKDDRKVVRVEMVEIMPDAEKRPFCFLPEARKLIEAKFSSKPIVAEDNEVMR